MAITIKSSTFTNPYQFAEDHIAPRPTSEKVALLVKHFSDPYSQPFDGAIFPQLGFDNCMTAFKAIKQTLTPSLPNNPYVVGTPEYASFQQTVAQKQQVAQDAYTVAYDRMEIQMRDLKKQMIENIKSKKFPAYSSADPATKSIGASELAVANSTPLKHINCEVLENYWQAGRIDLTSALVERFALNRYQFEGKDAIPLQKFAVRYYDAINVQSNRTQLRYLNATIRLFASYKGVAPLLNQVGGLDIATQNMIAQQEYEKSVADDTLLEM